VPLRFTWKRSPTLALPFGQTLLTVSFGASLSVFVMVHVAVSPKLASVPEQSSLRLDV